MIDYEKEFQTASYAVRQDVTISRVFAVVYGWMGAGLLLSGLVAWHTFTSGLWERILSGPGFIGCIVAELALVFCLSAAINKIPAALATVLFLAYAALNGLTLSVVFVAYEIALVQNVFFITAGMFAGLAVYGTFTKSDLSSIGSVCGMAVWGLVIALLVNLFLKSSGLDLIISFAGVLIFTGLTMYDANKIKMLAQQSGTLDAATAQKVGILGALTLYLDFVNLFLYLLRLFGRRR